MIKVPGDLGGLHPLANWLNRLKEALRARTLLPGVGYKLRETTNGVILQIQPGGTGGGRSAAYRVKSANGDYLVCRTYNGTSEGSEDVNIAKPFDARQLTSETLDGVATTYTYTGAATVLNRFRTASFSGTTEQQQVVPLWKVDGLIRVMSIDYSGVTVDDADLKLMEISSRAWARV